MLHSYWRTKDVSKAYDVLGKATLFGAAPPRAARCLPVSGCLVYLPFWRFQGYGRFEDTSWFRAYGRPSGNVAHPEITQE